MPIWSLTQERLDKLNDQIKKKKEEHDALDVLDEKDLWCKDLDQFVTEWETQLKLDAEIQTSIRRMGRRASKKIGAGKSRRKRDDDDYEPVKKGKTSKAAPRKKTVVEQFTDTFNAEVKPQIKREEGNDDFSDDDLEALGRKRTLSATIGANDKNGNGRGKRAAASKPKTWEPTDDELSESDGNDVLDDVDQLVKGIKETGDTKPSSRLSRISMSRTDQSSSTNATERTNTLPKTKAKSARAFMVDSDDDDTNYEMLARSSPKKAPTKSDDVYDLDSFLSDEAPPPKSTARTTSAAGGKSIQPPPASRVPLNVTGVKKRGRPAGSKNNPKNGTTSAEAASKTTSTKTTKRSVKKPSKGGDSDQAVEDIHSIESPSPPAAVRRRPGRAAAAKATVILSDDDGDSSQDDSDPFSMDE
ncbi:hypothetical protein IL306_015035 [Fusarium sp. DS 682]|nr:hypothetical protein IL306_015035 [Fusarium sp. DS 682]